MLQFGSVISTEISEEVFGRPCPHPIASMWLRHFDGDQIAARFTPAGDWSLQCGSVISTEISRPIRGPCAESWRLQCGSVISTEISSYSPESLFVDPSALQCGSVISTEISHHPRPTPRPIPRRFNVAPSFRRRSDSRTASGAVATTALLQCGSVISTEIRSPWPPAQTPTRSLLQCGSVISTEISSSRRSPRRRRGRLQCGSVISTEISRKGQDWGKVGTDASMWLRHFDGDQPPCCRTTASRCSGFNVAPSFRRRSAPCSTRTGGSGSGFNVAPSFRRRSEAGHHGRVRGFRDGFNVAPSFRRRSAALISGEI